jgi:DNA polymerase III epsilon subunit-like protein
MNYTQLRLTEITFLALDTETTGLFPILHRLVEVGAVRFRLDGCELAAFQSLINPEIPIPKDVQRVHGITDRMVRCSRSGPAGFKVLKTQSLNDAPSRLSMNMVHNPPDPARHYLRDG